MTETDLFVRHEAAITIDGYLLNDAQSRAVRMALTDLVAGLNEPRDKLYNTPKGAPATEALSAVLTGVERMKRGDVSAPPDHNYAELAGRISVALEGHCREDADPEVRALLYGCIREAGAGAVSAASFLLGRASSVLKSRARAATHDTGMSVAARLLDDVVETIHGPLGPPEADDYDPEDV